MKNLVVFTGAGIMRKVGLEPLETQVDYGKIIK